MLTDKYIKLENWGEIHPCLTLLSCLRMTPLILECKINRYGELIPKEGVLYITRNYLTIDS